MVALTDPQKFSPLKVSHYMVWPTCKFCGEKFGRWLPICEFSPLKVSHHTVFCVIFLEKNTACWLNPPAVQSTTISSGVSSMISRLEIGFSGVPPNLESMASKSFCHFTWSSSGINYMYMERRKSTFMRCLQRQEYIVDREKQKKVKILECKSMNKFISQHSLPLFNLCKTSIGYLFDRMDQGFGTDPCLLVGGRGLRAIDQQTLSNIYTEQQT